MINHFPSKFQTQILIEYSRCSLNQKPFVSSPLPVPATDRSKCRDHSLPVGRPTRSRGFRVSMPMDLTLNPWNLGYFLSAAKTLVNCNCSFLQFSQRVCHSFGMNTSCRCAHGSINSCAPRATRPPRAGWQGFLYRCRSRQIRCQMRTSGTGPRAASSRMRGAWRPNFPASVEYSLVEDDN